MKTLKQLIGGIVQRVKPKTTAAMQSKPFVPLAVVPYDGGVIINGGEEGDYIVVGMQEAPPRGKRDAALCDRKPRETNAVGKGRFPQVRWEH